MESADLYTCRPLIDNLALILQCTIMVCLTLYVVSTLPGLLMSSDLYSTLTLEEAQYLQPLTQFMVSVTLEGCVLPHDKASPQLLLQPTRILL